jgi:hypothetical protein
MTDETRDYVQSLIGKPVLHTGLYVIDIPARLFEPGEYIDKDGNPIDKHVMQCVNGNVFIVSDNTSAFVAITPLQVQVFEQLTSDMRMLIVGACVALRSVSTAASGPEAMKHAVAIVRTALAQQTRALGS